MPYVPKKEFYDLLDARALADSMRSELDARNDDLNRVSGRVLALMEKVASLEADNKKMLNAIDLATEALEEGNGPKAYSVLSPVCYGHERAEQVPVRSESLGGTKGTRLEQIRERAAKIGLPHSGSMIDDCKFAVSAREDIPWLLERLDEMRKAAKLGAMWADKGASHARRSRNPAGTKAAEKHAEKIRASIAKLEK